MGYRTDPNPGELRGSSSDSTVEAKRRQDGRCSHVRRPRIALGSLVCVFFFGSFCCADAMHSDLFDRIRFYWFFPATKPKAKNPPLIM